MQNPFARISNPALREGLLFGIILAVVSLLLSFVNLGSLGNFVALGLYVVLALTAGLRASRQTGKVSTGLLAGLWTGLFGSLIPSIVSLIFTLANIDMVRKLYQDAANQQHLSVKYTNSDVITLTIVGLLINIALVVLLGVAGGLAGGALGKGRAQLSPPPEYQETRFEPPAEPQPAESLPSTEPPPREPPSSAE